VRDKIDAYIYINLGLTVLKEVKAAHETVNKWTWIILNPTTTWILISNVKRTKFNAESQFRNEHMKSKHYRIL